MKREPGQRASLPDIGNFRVPGYQGAEKGCSRRERCAGVCVCAILWRRPPFWPCLPLSPSPTPSIVHITIAYVISVVAAAISSPPSWPSPRRRVAGCERASLFRITRPLPYVDKPRIQPSPRRRF